MTCNTFQEQFVEYLLNELSAAEAEAIREHLSSGCKECCRDFAAIREGANLLFAAVPRSTVSASKRDEIFERALQASTKLSLSSGATMAEPYVPLEGRHAPAKLSGSEATIRRPHWQALLALAAGFAAVLAIPLADTLQQTSNQLGSSTESSVPANKVEPRLVSFHYVTREKQSDAQELTGFLLVDTQAGEIHLLGASMPQLHQALPMTLVIVTASGVTHHPLTFTSNGNCKTLVPLPKEPILKMEIRQSE